MGLIKFKEYRKQHQDIFSDRNFVNFDDFSVYSGEEKIGSLKNALIDENSGRFRYLVVDTGPWIFGKNVLLPIGLAKFDYSHQRIYANGLTREQVESLPEYRSDMTVDYDYEENLRQRYRPMGNQRQFMGQNYTVNGDRTFTQPQYNDSNRPAYDKGTYDYNYDESLYGREADGQGDALRLYEEHLVASKVRQKAGEVSVSKRIETDRAEVSIPVEKERIIVEVTEPKGATAAVPNGKIQAGEVAHMNVYEEKAKAHKETVVAQDVSVRKSTEQETVRMKDSVRRETLDVDGNAEIINR